ncbi:unnamed protein product [Orchesella dallaii]|uniref:Uncharacterized protein n=1 Tax=Orchesella dallaii TaxID=48710 RepID=A0ABP1SA43_9HEXA
MMARIMRTDQRLVNPGDDKFKLTTVFCYLFSQLYKAKNCVAGFPSQMGAGLALPFEHEVLKKNNIQQLDFPAATAIGLVFEPTPFQDPENAPVIEPFFNIYQQAKDILPVAAADMRRYKAQVMHQKADLASSESNLSAAKAEHAQCKVVLKILEDTLVGGLWSMARSLAERGCRTYKEFVDIILTSNDFNFQALQQGLASSLRVEAITTLELPGVASPGGDIRCGLCITARNFRQGIAEQQQQGEQQLEDGGEQQQQLENGGEQQQDNGADQRQQLENGGEHQQEQEDGELPGANKGKDMERLLQLHQQEAPGNPSLIGMMTMTLQGTKRRMFCRGIPDDDADAAGNEEADDVRPGEPVNHQDSDDDATDSMEVENRVLPQFSSGAYEGWVDLSRFS